MNIYSIYYTHCKITSLYYIGFDSNWPHRKKDHINESKNKKQSAYWYEISKAIRKYGKENFEWDILYQSLDGEHTLKVMENHFITQYNSYYKWENGGYNMTLGGEGTLGWVPSIETKLKWKKQRTREEQSRRRSMHWILIDSAGKEYKVFNLDKFCKENGLNQSCMTRIGNGIKNWKSHKGWTCSKITSFM